MQEWTFKTGWGKEACPFYLRRLLRQPWPHPKLRDRSPVDLKNQLQVALAGAIGLTAGAILWEAIFLHEIGSLIERFADWIRVILLGGSITLAWAHGTSRSPQRAARLGALTGAIVGGAFDLVFWIFGETPCQARSRQIDSTDSLYV